ncbi:MAG: uroporphyrinogen decarboxylase family protein [Armatimonadota bacterium]|nr:uroporphyrinogen decarboxylase family protein [Armatimonadota bacterium]
MRTGGTAKVDVMFDASWWSKLYGISFDENYVRAHPRYRAELEGKMRRALYERFGSVGLGSESDEPVPVISTQMTPLNYIVGEVFGCGTYFSEGNTPCTIPLRLGEAELEDLRPPDVMNTPVMQKLVEDMDWLEKEYGRVIGDINPQGVLNNAMCVADAEIFVLFITNPELARRVLHIVTDTMIKVISYIKGRTGTSSISVTNIVAQVNPSLLVTSNCSTTMIAPETYREYLLECDRALADALPPFGIHHCGMDLAKMAPEYKKVRGLDFLEVGWGSDVAAVRSLLPETHLNARYSPVKMRDASPETIDKDVKALIEAGTPLEKLSISILGLDDTVPDENVIAFFEAAERHWE